MLSIQGRSNNQASRFEFNLLTGNYSGADVAFHFNPRFDQREAVRNACSGGAWGPEEKQGGFPLQPGQPFDIQIICFPEHYQVRAKKLEGSFEVHVRVHLGELQWSTVVHLSTPRTLSSSTGIASERRCFNHQCSCHVEWHSKSFSCHLFENKGHGEFENDPRHSQPTRERMHG